MEISETSDLPYIYLTVFKTSKFLRQMIPNLQAMYVN